MTAIKAHDLTPKARSKANIPAYPLHNARMTSNPLIVA